MSHSALIGVTHKQDAPHDVPSLPPFDQSLSFTQCYPGVVLAVSGVLIAVAGVAGLIAGAQ